MSFFESLGNILQQVQPEFERQNMYAQGIDQSIVEPQYERARANQATQIANDRKQSIAQKIIAQADTLTPQQIMAIGAQDADLGRLAASIYKESQKTMQMQQKQQFIQGDATPEEIMQFAAMTGDAPLMEYGKQKAGTNKIVNDERGRLIRANTSTGEVLPLGGGNMPTMNNAQPYYQPLGDETMLGGDGSPAPNIDTNITTSNIPDINKIAARDGLDLTNPTDAKTAERRFNSEITTYKINVEKNSKSQKANDILPIIVEAKKLLPSATSGGLETNIRDVKQYFGYSGKEAETDARLNLLSAALTSSVPRFEGPQGVLDVQLYKQAAADVGNSALNPDVRGAALDTMEQLQRKYAGQPSTIGESKAQSQSIALPEGAKQAPDGNYYVEQNGKFFKVNAQ